MFMLISRVRLFASMSYSSTQLACSRNRPQFAGAQRRLGARRRPARCAQRALFCSQRKTRLSFTRTFNQKEKEIEITTCIPCICYFYVKISKCASTRSYDFQNISSAELSKIRTEHAICSPLVVTVMGNVLRTYWSRSHLGNSLQNRKNDRCKMSHSRNTSSYLNLDIAIHWPNKEEDESLKSKEGSRFVEIFGHER